MPSRTGDSPLSSSHQSHQADSTNRRYSRGSSGIIKNAFYLTLLNCAHFQEATPHQVPPCKINANQFNSLRGTASSATSPTISSADSNPGRCTETTHRELQSTNSAGKGAFFGMVVNNVADIEQEWKGFNASGNTVLTPDAITNSTYLSELITDKLGYKDIDNYLELLAENYENHVTRDANGTLISVELETTTSDKELLRMTQCEEFLFPVSLSDNLTETFTNIDDDAYYVQIKLADNRFDSQTSRACRSAPTISFDGPRAGENAKQILQLYVSGNNERNNFQAQVINLALGHGGNYPTHLGTISGNTLGYNEVSGSTSSATGIFMDPSDSARDKALTWLHEMTHDMHKDSRDNTSIFDDTGLFRDTGTSHSREQVAYLASVIIQAYENGIDRLQNFDHKDYSADLFPTDRFRPRVSKEVDGDYVSTPAANHPFLVDRLDQFFDLLNQKEYYDLTLNNSFTNSTLEAAYDLYHEMVETLGETITLSYTDPGDESRTFSETYNTKIYLMETILLAYQHNLFFPDDKPAVSFYDNDPTSRLFIKNGIEHFVAKLIEKEGAEDVKLIIESAAHNLYLGIHHIPFTNEQYDQVFDVKVILTPVAAFILGLCSNKIYNWCARKQQTSRPAPSNRRERGQQQNVPDHTKRENKQTQKAENRSTGQDSISSRTATTASLFSSVKVMDTLNESSAEESDFDPIELDPTEFDSIELGSSTSHSSRKRPVKSGSALDWAEATDIESQLPVRSAEPEPRFDFLEEQVRIRERIASLKRAQLNQN